MIEGIGVQSKNVVNDDNPYVGFNMLKNAGFDYCDFSLNGYFYNKDIYESAKEGVLKSHFFDKDIEDLKLYFSIHKDAACQAGIIINQMHMPYPVYIPGAEDEINDYLIDVVAVKSMQLAAFFECPNIVIHGFKIAPFYGTEKEEWEATEKFIDRLAPFAIENNICICVENLYNSINGKLVDGPCTDALLVAKRIDDFNNKYGREVLGFCFDTGHANLCNIDFEDFLIKLGKRVKVLHVHDNDCELDLHQIPFTFTKTRDNTSSTDWESFINGLKKINFDGVLSFETAPVLTAFPDELKLDTLKFINKIGRYFERRINDK